MQLSNIQDALRNDASLMDVLHNNPERMEEYHEEYKQDKAENRKAIMRVSSHSAATAAGKSLSLLQGKVWVFVDFITFVCS